MTVTQDQFRAALLDSAQAVPEGLLDANDAPAGRRFNVYRNNVAVSLTEAMHQAFPVITKLLGAQNMDGLAGIFLRQYPPSSPLMMHYGDAFPDFLAGMQQLSHLGYLPDVARLELALRRSYHAADSTAISPEALAIDPEILMEATIEFAPAMQLIRSDWPIASIWTFNTQDGSPKPQAVAEDVLITRVEFDPEPHVLPSGGADWIDALMAGKTIGEAHEIAEGLSPGFGLGATLALLLQGGAIITLTTKG
ncbi:putative DNA-binding domain-containing protein [Tropicibacter sp. R16_0]|uniref:HvfC/BufC N-terminal domain-containing protein n=1 Tax=Tropicibacter sp. R16_0 TaxID=2821102 RepID=UPI001ADCB730|nr:DNA-binding domain-containing protein [Tropicibacter sp. R16_0]MBO9449987.1 putative DNA-binding domain-containing protein [Tropicibacter sp. R16_0]